MQRKARDKFKPELKGLLPNAENSYTIEYVNNIDKTKHSQNVTINMIVTGKIIKRNFSAHFFLKR